MNLFLYTNIAPMPVKVWDHSRAFAFPTAAETQKSLDLVSPEKSRCGVTCWLIIGGDAPILKPEGEGLSTPTLRFRLEADPDCELDPPFAPPEVPFDAKTHRLGLR